MPGVQRRPTVVKMEEESQAKDKIKFDIFNNGEETLDYMKKTVLDNVSMHMLKTSQDDVMAKPVMMKTNKTAKKYEFFDDDE